MSVYLPGGTTRTQQSQKSGQRRMPLTGLLSSSNRCADAFLSPVRVSVVFEGRPVLHALP